MADMAGMAGMASQPTKQPTNPFPVSQCGGSGQATWLVPGKMKVCKPCNSPSAFF
jgi:hypothetical protein